MTFPPTCPVIHQSYRGIFNPLSVYVSGNRIWDTARNRSPPRAITCSNYNFDSGRRALVRKNRAPLSRSGFRFVSFFFSFLRPTFKNTPVEIDRLVFQPGVICNRVVQDDAMAQRFYTVQLAFVRMRNANQRLEDNTSVQTICCKLTQLKLEFEAHRVNVVLREDNCERCIAYRRNIAAKIEDVERS